MASTSRLNYLTGEVGTKIEAILKRTGSVTPGTPVSDQAAQLLRDLSTALDAFGTRSVDVANAVHWASQAGE